MVEIENEDNFNKAFDELNEIHKKITEMSLPPEELKALTQRANRLVLTCEEILFQIEDELKEAKKNLK